MARTYVVQIDLARVKHHRSKAEQRTVSTTEAINWLKRLGFYPHVDGLYLADDAVLERANPTEVRSVRPIGNLLH